MDLSGLPETAYGHRAPIWWGTIALIVIEGMAFAMTAAGYFYLRMGYREWPPPDAARPDWIASAVNVALLGIIAIPMRRIQRAAPHIGCERLLRLLLRCVALIAMSLVIRVFEFRGLNAMWHEHSYGSVVWALIFLHTFHLGIHLGETSLLALHVAKKGLDDHHRVDVAVNSVYWYFIVVSWLVLAGIIYFVGPLI
jgi:heme/copper-type cytochrome/quinol oxidase subunit 3